MWEADRLKQTTDIQILRQYELYVLDDNPSSEHHIIYAPLADSAFVAGNEDISGLAEAARRDGNADKSYIETFRDLTDVIPVAERQGQIHSEIDFINLSILPNNVCNFSCSYCYSAKGRSSARIDFEAVRTAIDYFFALPRPVTPPLLTVSIFGGGEPLLSWKGVVRPAIEHICNRQLPEGQRVVITLITNGSTVGEEILSYCRRYKIDLVVSFDILEDVQNAQRRHFDEVAANIRYMIDNGVVPAVNAVVTELNVMRQVEMIESLHLHFPEIKYVSFEPVIGTVRDRKNFYRQMSVNFIEAMDKALEYGIALSCSTLRNLDVTVDRYCAGEFALCPDGSISVCPCVSSAEEPNYEQYIYGHVAGGEVMIDRDRLLRLLSVNVHGYPWCRHCFAKWNCGGGCMNTNVTNGGRQDTDYCTFTRTLTRHFLYKRLEKTYREDYNEDLTQYVDKDEYIVR